MCVQFSTHLHFIHGQRKHFTHYKPGLCTVLKEDPKINLSKKVNSFVTEALGLHRHTRTLTLTESTSNDSPKTCWEFWDQLERRWWAEHLIFVAFPSNCAHTCLQSATCHTGSKDNMAFLCYNVTPEAKA